MGKELWRYLHTDYMIHHLSLHICYLKVKTKNALPRDFDKVSFEMFFIIIHFNWPCECFRGRRSKQWLMVLNKGKGTLAMRNMVGYLRTYIANGRKQQFSRFWKTFKKYISRKMWKSIGKEVLFFVDIVAISLFTKWNSYSIMNGGWLEKRKTTNMYG